MKKTAMFVISLVLMSLLTAGLGISASTKPSSVEKGKQAPGWCFKGVKIFRSTESGCVKHAGRFFKDKKSADAFLDAWTPGFCCADGRLVASKKGGCRKRKGRFFEDKRAATTWCDEQQKGYCCTDGRVVATIKADCLKRKGKFFTDKPTAARACDPKGWCVVGGKVFAGRQSACARKKGRFFTRKRQAVAAARPARGGQATSSAQVVAVVRPTVVKPDLKIGDLRYVDASSEAKTGGSFSKARPRAYLSFQIANAGKGPIDATQFNKSRVRLTLGGHVDRSITRLGQLVSFNALKRPGARRTCRVYRELSGRQVVAIHINSNGAIVEQSAANNHASVRLGHARKASRKPGRGKKRVAAMPPVIAADKKGKKRLPTSTVQGAGPLAGTSSGPNLTHPMILDMGIRVTYPSTGAVVHRGQSLHIRYRFTREVEPGGQIKFALKRGDMSGPALATIAQDSGSNGRSEREIVLPVPTGDSIPDGEGYVIVAEHDPSHAFGMSDVFRIQAIGEGGGSIASPHIHIISPQAGYHNPYSDVQLHIKWRYSGPLEDCPADWRIEITRAGQDAPERTLTADCRNPVDEPAADPSGDPTRTCSKTLDYIADGSYNLRITGGPYSDQTDGVFHIGTDMDWPHIQIFNPTPRAGDTLSRDDPMTVSFSVNPAAANVDVMIQRHGETAYLFPALGSANSADCTVDGNIRRCQKTILVPEALTAGTEYKTVINGVPHAGARAERGPFQIIEPSVAAHRDSNAVITVPIQVQYPEGVHYIGNPMTIHWSIPGNEGRQSRVRIALVNLSGEEVLQLTRYADANLGEYTWIVGANFYGGSGWYYNPSTPGNFRWGQPHAVRIIDVNDPSNFSQGSFFEMQTADLRVWTSGAKNKGIEVHWQSSNLESSVKMIIRCGYVAHPDSGCYKVTETGDPLAGRHFVYIDLFNGIGSSGSFFWRFGESISTYPDCPCFHKHKEYSSAYIVAYPAGFRAFYSAISGDFHVPSRGCTETIPTEEWGQYRRKQ